MIDTAEPVSSSILGGLPSTSKSTQIISLLAFLTLCTSKVANKSSYASTLTSTSTARTSGVLVVCLGLPCCLDKHDKHAGYGPVFHSDGRSGPCKNNCVSYVCYHHSGSKGGGGGGRRFRWCWFVVFSQLVNVRDWVGVELTL